MKKTILSIIFIVGVLLIAPGAFATNPQEIKLLLFKNARHIYTITQENSAIENGKKLEAAQTLLLKIDHRVADVLPNGNFRIELAIKRFAIMIRYENKILRYDSDTVDVTNPLYKMLNFFTDVQLNYEVSREGVVSKFSGFEPIETAVGKELMLKNILNDFGSKSFYTGLYNYIPKSVVQPGVSWVATGIIPELDQMQHDIKYTLKEVSPQSIVLLQESTFKMSSELPAEPSGEKPRVKQSGLQKGTLNLDPKTNMRVSSSLTQTVDASLIREKAELAADRIKNMKLTIKTDFRLEPK